MPARQPDFRLEPDERRLTLGNTADLNADVLRNITPVAFFPPREHIGCFALGQKAAVRQIAGQVFRFDRPSVDRGSRVGDQRCAPCGTRFVRKQDIPGRLIDETRHRQAIHALKRRYALFRPVIVLLAVTLGGIILEIIQALLELFDLLAFFAGLRGIHKSLSRRLHQHQHTQEYDQYALRTAEPGRFVLTVRLLVNALHITLRSVRAEHVQKNHLFARPVPHRYNKARKGCSHACRCLPCGTACRSAGTRAS